MAEAMKLAEVVETLEALTKSPGADEFDKGARAARLDALDMLRPLAASPPAREEAPDEGAGLYNQGFSDGIAAQALRTRNRTSEPEAGENSQNDYSPRKTLTDPAPATADKLPDDVRRLVLAARAVAFGPDSGTSGEINELDKASEAFADRVPWDDEPLAALNEQPQ